MMISPAMIRLVLISASLVLAFLFGWVANGWRHDATMARDVAAAAAITKQNQEKADEREKQAIAMRDLHWRTYVADIERLHARRDRLPDAARADCAGSTGAELSRQDAASFTRLAFDCQRESEALAGCYEHVDALSCRVD